MPLRRDLRRLAALPSASLPILLRAIAELALARTRLGSHHARRLVRDGRSSDPVVDAPSTAHRALIDDVGFAVPLAANRVPWRADCMVQALAAERWLRRGGVACRLIVGVRSGSGSPLDAHAWLTVADRVVTGGDVSDFAPLGRAASRP